jgi:hypothetical protein
VKQRRSIGWRRLFLMPLLLLAVLTLVLAASLGIRTAHAQSGTTLTTTFTVASPAKLLARTTLQISGTASCTLPDGATLIEQPGGTVTVSQASGRQIIKADSGSFSLGTTCDGTPHTFQVFATPPPGSAPFHGGSAIATGTIFVSWTDASGNFHEDAPSSSPETITITS